MSHLLTVLAGVSVLSLPLSAQTFFGSDDFNSGFNPAKWDYSFRVAGSNTSNGLLDFTNSRLDFSKSDGAGSQFRIWDSDGTATPAVSSLSYSTSWVMTMTVTNALGGLSGSDYATIGIQVENDNLDYLALMLSATSTGNYIRAEGINFNAVNAATATNTDVILRLTWDAGAQSLTPSYSFDGSTYNSLSIFYPVSKWNNSGSGDVSNGFNFEVFGNSNLAGAISVGSVYADNFSVSAVPEPSTYAIFAGLGALGLAAWRRRRARAA